MTTSAMQITISLQSALKRLDEHTVHDERDEIYRLLAAHIRSANPWALLQAEEMERAEPPPPGSQR